MADAVIDLTSPEKPSPIKVHVGKLKKRPLVRLRRVKDRPRVERLRSRQSDHADFFALTKSRTSSSDIYGSERSKRKKFRTTNPESSETEVLRSSRKRKKGSGSNLMRAIPVNKSHRGIKPSTSNESTKQSQVWTYKYCPTKVSELAIHPKKLSEVKQWMTTALSDKQSTWSPHKLLILQGPAGIGKSTMALLLAKEMGATIRQWKGRRSQASNGFTRRGRSTFGGLHDFPTKYTNELDEFRDFLFQSKRYRGLLLQKTSMAIGMGSKKTLKSNRSKELIVIDAIPYLRNDESKDVFVGILEHFLQTTMFPAVMVFTETIEAGRGFGKEIKYNNARKFLSAAIMDSPSTRCISVNPVAHTFMVNALKRILACDRLVGERSYDVVTREDLNTIARSARGDLRHAINSLQFFVNGSTVQVQVSSKQTRKRTNSSRKSVNLANDQTECGRSNFFDPLHSINKIIYSKLLPDTLAGEKAAAAAAVAAAKSSSKPIKQRQDVEQVLLDSQYPLHISMAFVHHNCERQFTQVEDLAAMAETLSDCDMFQPYMWNNSASLVFPRRYFATLLGNSVAMHNRAPASRKGRGFHAGAVRRPPQLDMSKLRQSNHDSMKSVFSDDGVWMDCRTGRLLDTLHYAHRIATSDAHYAGIDSMSSRQRTLIASMHQYSEPYVNVPPPGSRNHLTGGVWGEWPVGKSLLTHDYRTDLSNTEKRSALASSEEDIEEW